MHRIGKETASAEVTESNVTATALFEGIAPAAPQATSNWSSVTANQRRR